MIQYRDLVEGIIWLKKVGLFYSEFIIRVSLWNGHTMKTIGPNVIKHGYSSHEVMGLYYPPIKSWKTHRPQGRAQHAVLLNEIRHEPIDVFSIVSKTKLS